MKDNICKIYEYLTSEVSGNKMYLFAPSKSHIKMISNFEKLIDTTSIGSNWTYNFLVFQFSRYNGMKTRFGDKVQFNWVIGKKALEKWNNRSEEEIYYADEFRRKYRLKNPLVSQEKITLNKDTIRQNSSIIDCINMKLYLPMNKVCFRCEHKKVCSKL